MASADDCPDLHYPDSNGNFPWDYPGWSDTERYRHTETSPEDDVLILKIRMVEEKNLTSECPFPPTEDEYIRDVTNLCDNIELTLDIKYSNKSVSYENDEISLSTTLIIEEVRKRIRPLFANVFCSIRFVSIKYQDITTIGNLMWAKESKEMRWDKATEYAENLKLGGYNDWRLPTLDEMDEIIRGCGGTTVELYGDNYDAIQSKNIANVSYQFKCKEIGFSPIFYLSEAAYRRGDSKPWGYGFDFSDGSWYLKDSSTHFRCVRTVKQDEAIKYTKLDDLVSKDVLNIINKVSGDGMPLNFETLYLKTDVLNKETGIELDVIASNFRSIVDNIEKSLRGLKHNDLMKEFRKLKILAHLPNDRVLLAPVRIDLKDGLIDYVAKSMNIETKLLDSKANDLKWIEPSSFLCDAEFQKKLLSRLKNFANRITKKEYKIVLSKTFSTRNTQDEHSSIMSKVGSKKMLKRLNILLDDDITLMWEKESRKMKWNEAMEYAKSLRFGGYDDWRLPSKEELAEVVTLCGGIVANLDDDNWEEISNKNEVNEAYQANYKAKGFSSSNYWSSTTYAGGTSYAWDVDFDYGDQDYDSKSNDYYVRCVRSGQ